MDLMIFNDIVELGSEMYEAATEDGRTVSAVVFYPEAIELLRYFSVWDDVEMVNIEIDNGELSDYHGEYFVTFTSDSCLFIEPAIRDGVVLINDCNLAYYETNVDKAIISESPCEEEYIFKLIERKDDCCKDCCNDCSTCKICCNGIPDRLQEFWEFCEKFDN